LETALRGFIKAIPGNLAVLEDAEEMALDAAAGNPRTDAVGLTPRV
jgi:hypothetical protein